MALKPMKPSIPISEMQRILHQWKKRGLSDSTITKLLDLYLGLPAFMDAKGIYPLCNFYDLRLSLRFPYTSTLITAVTTCQSFGLIWDTTGTKIIAFYTPIWYQKKKGSDSDAEQVPPQEIPQDLPQTFAQELPQEFAQKTPQDLPQDFAQDFAFNNNILYNINNIYPPEDTRQGLSAENATKKEAVSAENETENAAENPNGNPSENPAEASSPAADFFHRLNAEPKDKQRALVPIIDSIVANHHYTRPRAVQALVILVNRFLIPYFDADPRFSKNSHEGRIIWLQNLLKAPRGKGFVQQALTQLGKELNREVEEKRRKAREYRPISPHEWKDADKDIRYYDDPIDGKVDIPQNAPPRPTDTAIWNVLSQQWVGEGMS